MTKPVVLITGALTGIGRATALAFAAGGYDLVVSGRNASAGEKLADELRALGAEAEFVRADVRFEEEVTELVSSTVSRFGRLDAAVNNAGTEGALGPVTSVTTENFHDVFDTNVLGTVLCMKHQLPLMVAQGSGSIINLSSMGGHVGFPGASVYTASKHAVEGLTKTAALEVAAMGVRVNAVAPGPVATAMLDRIAGGNTDAMDGMLALMPAKRAARAEEIAQTILFLASDKAPFITGQIVTIDGGYTAQ